MEPTTPLDDLFEAQRMRMQERRLLKVLKHIRRARYVLLTLFLMILAPIAVNLICNTAISMRECYFDIGAMMFYLVLFFVSRRFPFQAFVVAVAGFIMLNSYLVKVYYVYFVCADAPDGVTLFALAMAIGIVVRLVLLSFLINGAVRARHYNELVNEQ